MNSLKITFSSALASMVAIAGCTPTCPPSVPITLTNGSTVTAEAGSGAASQAGSSWAFNANASEATSILGIQIIPGTSVFLFRMEYGAGGQLVRLFDNAKFAPDSFGSQIIFDGSPHPMVTQGQNYSGIGYGAESGIAVANLGCLHIIAQIADVVHVTIQFTGTENATHDRIDGTLKFITEVNPAYASQVPPNVMSQTVEVSAFAVKGG
ncbi:MAG TPA: hypothetical protein VMV81_06100 [Phycisphaerae bacterium]|nr:hypothetical protein [Phycisphaerae bacterium]